MLIIIIIIILLLLHCCNGKKNNGSIDICTGDDCVVPGKTGLKINCLEELENKVCIVPDFRGKTENEIIEWLDKISNNIDISYQVYDSDELDGIVIYQSNEENITVKDLLENNIPLVISFANTRTAKVDCITNQDNKNCVVPDFTGKTKNDVYKWLNKISNEIKIEFDNKDSSKENGTIIGQSLKKGTNVKDIVEKNKTLDITFANKEKVDCLKDKNNSACFIPNFTGSTQKEIEDWLDSISNTINLNYENTKSEFKSKTVVDQSVKPGSSINDLIKNNTPLTIVFATNEKEQGLDCLKDINNSNCVLPDFTGMTKRDVQEWLNKFTNNIPVRYKMVNSTSNDGSILKQSIASGTTVKDIIESDKQLVISISNYVPKKENKPKEDVIDNEPQEENNEEENQNVEPEPEPIPEEEKDKVVIKDSSVTWEDETEINIFENVVADTKIAPESSNTYRFSINNNTEYNVKYDITFIETNDYNINMKYKLRKNNSYVVSEYVSIDEINITDQLLNASKNDVFYLEWKWISGDNDIDLGTNPSASYTLRIEVEAESINE